jgi:hypothetical protein
MDFSVERLYYSNDFQSFIDRLTYKTGIRDREDYKHDVFAEIIATDAESLIDCKRAARRVAYQHGRELQFEQATFDGAVIV